MKNFLYIIFSALSLGLNAQAVIADNMTPDSVDPTSILDVQSSTRGIIVPRLSETAIETLKTTAADGLIVFNTTDKCYYGFLQNDWVNLDGNCLVTPPAPAPLNFEGGDFIFTGFQSYKGNDSGDGANQQINFL